MRCEQVQVSIGFFWGEILVLVLLITCLLFVDHSHLIYHGMLNIIVDKESVKILNLKICCPCFIVADEPVLRDNEALRKNCLVPMVNLTAI